VKAPSIQGFWSFFCCDVHLRVRLIVTRDKNVLIRSYVAGPIHRESGNVPQYFIGQATLSGSVQNCPFPSVERNVNGRTRTLRALADFRKLRMKLSVEFGIDSGWIPIC
jgi:hypothetical protein